MAFVKQNLPTILNALGVILGLFGAGNAVLLGQSAEGITAQSGLQYVGSAVLASVGSFYAAHKTKPNADLRRMVDGLLASGDFDRAKAMIQQWESGK